MGCRYLFNLVFPFPLHIFPEVELLNHVVVLFLIFWGSSILFSIVDAPIYSPTNSARVFSFLHILMSFCYLVSFLMIAILTGVMRYLIVVLICISLMISDVEHLFMCLLAIHVQDLSYSKITSSLSSMHIFAGIFIYELTLKGTFHSLLLVKWNKSYFFSLYN